jgi:hypothetical protein
MLLAGNLQHSGNRGIVGFQHMSNIIGNVLVDENDTDIITSREIGEGVLDLIQFSVLLDNQKIGRTGGAVANTG